MFTRNSKAFADHNLTLKATPTEGPNARKPFTFSSRESVKGDPGGKTVALKGNTIGPLTIVPGGAEPTWDLKLSVMQESHDFAKHLDPDGTSGLGALGTHFDLLAVWSRPGLATITYEFTGCLVEKGFGFDTSSDKSPSDAISGKATDMKIDGVSIFTQPAA